MRRMSRREAIRLGSSAGLMFVVGPAAFAAAPLPSVTAYRNPGCGCCEKWANNMKEAGFDITMSDDPDLDSRRKTLGTPPGLAGCHLALVGDYVIEGHVPPEDVIALLAAKPNARGLAVPGMPMGSSGMEMGDMKEPYNVMIFTADGQSQVYSKHSGS